MIGCVNVMRRVGGGAPKTYADFVAWANTQPTNPADPTNFPFNLGDGRYEITLAATYSSSMSGSPWGPGNLPPAYGLFLSTSRFSRICQHAALSLAHATANLGRVVIVEVSYLTRDSSVGALNRNGYLSASQPYDPEEPYGVWICTRFDFFNDETGRRVQVNPRMATYQEFDLP